MRTKIFLSSNYPISGTKEKKKIMRALFSSADNASSLTVEISVDANGGLYFIESSIDEKRARTS